MKKQIAVKISISLFSLIVVLSIFYAIVGYIAAEAPDTIELLTASFKHYTNVQMKMAMFPFFFLSCCLYSFLAKRYYDIKKSTASIKEKILAAVAGFIIGIPALLVGLLLATVIGYVFFPIFNINSTMHISEITFWFSITLWTIFIGITSYSLLTQFEINKLKGKIKYIEKNN